MNEEKTNLRKSIKKIKMNENSHSLTIRKKINDLPDIFKKEKLKNMIKRELDEKLLQLFSSQSSLVGYKQDIDSLLKDLHLSKNDLFQIVLEFLSKSIKKDNEIRIIASYLFSMQGLINLLLKTKNLNIDNIHKEKQLLNDLLVLGSILAYEKFPKNYILIRFGEKGSKAYINLSGEVAVLIKKQYKLFLTEKEYLYYLANLIKYNEYELANIVINENFKSFPIEIIDDINEQDFDKKNSFSTSVKDLNKFNDIENIETIYNFDKQSPKDFSSFDLKEKKEKNNINASKKYFPKLKLNQENEKLKSVSSPLTIFASNLLKTYKLQFISKKLLNKCSVEEYINRLNVIKDFDFNEEKYNNQNCDLKDRSLLSIYSYINVVNLPNGSLFGDMALNNKNSLRTATIISLDECHCGVLNKKSYNNCLKTSAERNLRDILEFIVELPLFKGIQPAYFLKKYYTSLSRNYTNKNYKIIIQGEKPEYIALLKSGQYTIYTYNSLFNISNLMIYYLKLKQKIKKNDEMVNKIIQSLKITNKLLIQNEKFRHYYFSKNIFKVGVISSPDIIGYNEYTDQDGQYIFSIETNSLKNDYFLLKSDIYEEILQKNELVRNNQDKLFNSKLDLMLERLYNMRKIEINTFLELKTNSEIGKTITREIDDSIENKIKYKRTKKFNSTDYKFFLNQKDKDIFNSININSEINCLDSNKKSIILNSKQSKNRLSILNIKEISKNDNNKNNNINNNNISINNNIFSSKKIVNRNKKDYSISKFNKLFELIDSDNKLYSPTLSNKNYNKTIAYFNNFINNSNYKTNIKKLKEKIENYSQHKIKNKNKNFEGVCLNNMILEDIKEQIKFPIYDYNNSKRKKLYMRNKSKRMNKLIISQKIYNALKENKDKVDTEKSLSSMSEEYLVSLPIFKVNKEKKNKKIETNNNSFKNKVNYRNKILNIKQNSELDKIKYDIERNNYYKRNISKRLNFFFGNKKK